MDSNEYQVTIKSANQKVDDYITKCNPNWTVHQLKQHISETHVNKPSIEEQRLIYAGNLLKDSHTLKQIFFRDSLCTELTNSSKTDFTIHLVCSTYTQKPPSTSASASASSNSNPNSSASTTGNGRAATVNQPSVVPESQQAREQTASVSSDQSANQQQQSRARPQWRGGTMAITIHNIPVGPNTPLLAERVRNVMQSEQMRYQMAIFQQLANNVGAQLVRNLANNGVNSGTSTSNTSTSANTNTNTNTNSSNNNDRINQTPRDYMQLIENQFQLDATISENIAAAAASRLALEATIADQNPLWNQFASWLESAESAENAGGVVAQNENNESDANQPQDRRETAFVSQIRLPAPGVGEQPAAHAAPQPVAQPAPQPAPPQPAVVDHDVVQRDVIDWVYYSLRAAILMAALYIHASVFKLLFIVGLLAIAYFFNRRSTRRAQPNNIRQEQQAQPQQRQQDQPNVQAAQQAADNNDNAELRRRAAPNGGQNQVAADNEPTEGALAQTGPIGPQRVPFLKLIYLVVTDFLASMVPD